MQVPALDLRLLLLIAAVTNAKPVLVIMRDILFFLIILPYASNVCVP